MSLATASGITITAEGIVTEEQLQALRSMGVDFTQGYLFSPPVPHADFLSMQKKRDLLRGRLLDGGWEAVTTSKLRAAASGQ